MNKNKLTEPSRVAASPPTASGYRVADSDRALTAIGTLLMLYGRFAFDASEAASTVRERCEEWSKRLLFGDGRPAGVDGGERSVSRDFRGVERFFEEVRQAEAAFVTEQVGGLRRTVLSQARPGAARDARSALGRV